MLHFFTATKEIILQGLFPRRCPVCDGIVTPYGEKICLECLPKIRMITPPWCIICGRKLQKETDLCPECEQKKRTFRRGRILFEYAALQESMYRFKYSGRKEYGVYYGEQMAEFLADFIENVKPDGLIPIPLHKKRLRKRGYNQAEVVAREIGRRLGVPVYCDILVRVKNTKPLKQLSVSERQNNLKKAFKFVQSDVKLERVILVDDIFTTGSTIEEAARTLTLAGVDEVFFLTIAGA